MTAQIRHGAPTVEAAHALDPEPVDPMSWPSAILWGIVTGLALCAGAWLGIPALTVLSDALRGLAGLK
jgi:ABC-type nickel/cobalt efflux system permease component RcnA